MGENLPSVPRMAVEGSSPPACTVRIAAAMSAPWVEGLATTARDGERKARPVSRAAGAALDAGDALDTGDEVDATGLDAGSRPAPNARLSPSTSWSKPRAWPSSCSTTDTRFTRPLEYPYPAASESITILLPNWKPSTLLDRL